MNAPVRFNNAIVYALQLTPNTVKRFATLFAHTWEPDLLTEELLMESINSEISVTLYRNMSEVEVDPYDWVLYYMDAHKNAQPLCAVGQDELMLIAKPVLKEEKQP